jgi:hypothetical protein
MNPRVTTACVLGACSLGAVFVLVACLHLAARDSEATTTVVAATPVSRLQQPAPAVTETELFTAFSQDLLAAEQRFANQPLTLTLTAYPIEKDEQSRFCMRAIWQRTTKGGGVNHALRYVVMPASRPWLTLYLDPASLAAFTGLKKQQTITVTGFCRGTQVDRHALPEHILILDQVRLVTKD